MKLDRKRVLGGAAVVVVAVILWLELREGGEAVGVEVAARDSLSV